MHISERLHPKFLKLCTQASLIETFMWAKFQIEIRKYDFIGKLGPTGENSLKIQYLGLGTP